MRKHSGPLLFAPLAPNKLNSLAVQTIVDWVHGTKPEHNK